MKLENEPRVGRGQVEGIQFLWRGPKMALPHSGRRGSQEARAQHTGERASAPWVTKIIIGETEIWTWRPQWSFTAGVFNHYFLCAFFQPLVIRVFRGLWGEKGCFCLLYTSDAADDRYVV